MKVVHIECGLGDQMLDYCEYLAMRYAHPEEACYIETMVYDIPECGEVFSLWNGYELDRIFGIKAPNVRELFTDGQWENVLARARESRFWERSWNWPVYFCEAFRSEGLELNNIAGDFERNPMHHLRHLLTMQKTLYNSALGGVLRRMCDYAKMAKRLLRPEKETKMLFYKGTEDALTGHRKGFERRNNHIELIDREIRQAFTFPPFADERNIAFSDYIRSRESVAIHARRGDMLPFNGLYYKTGYFKKAVKYIKSKVRDPVFVFFCEPGSDEYCRKNLDKFFLDGRDTVHFADWNRGLESYRDMQLMSMCRHNIITVSSFGWWGSYLNGNPGKITISPEIEMNTTHHF